MLDSGVFSMNVSLTPELESLVNKKVKTGRYNSASEVVREALRLLEEQDRIRELRCEKLRQEIMKGEEQIRKGHYTKINSREESMELAERIIRRGHEKLKRVAKGEIADGNL